MNAHVLAQFRKGVKDPREKRCFLAAFCSDANSHVTIIISALNVENKRTFILVPERNLTLLHSISNSIKDCIVVQSLYNHPMEKNMAGLSYLPRRNSESLQV